MTGRVASVKATAPASVKRPNSVISLPSRFLVRAAMIATCTPAVSRARRVMKSTRAASSMTGDVLGMTTMVVTPPAAAASLALASVSRCSSPGSPVKTRMSTRPGASTCPWQSIVSMPDGVPCAKRWLPRSRMRPFSTSTAPLVSRPDAGSTRRAFMKAVDILLFWPCLLGGYWFGRWRERASSTAMRTATPISTCSRMRLLLTSSATRLSISTPRFIGPGCITSASGLAKLSFS